LTDTEWQQVAPLLPGDPPQGGRWRDHRQVVNGILWRIRTGVPWRDIPDRYGPWQTLHKRFRRWQIDGTWARIEAVLQMEASVTQEVDWERQHGLHGSQRGPAASALAPEKGSSEEAMGRLRGRGIES
jgi:transposase